MMKLDSEQVLCHGSVCHKSECESDDYSDGIVNSTGLKYAKESVQENRKGSLCDSKGRKVDADQFPYHIDEEDGWTATELDHAFGMDDLTDDNEKAVQEFVAPIPPTHSSMKMELFGDSVFYMDKSVMERELPEVIVCYKENANQAVKNICIDEVLPSQDKFLFDTDVASLCTLPPEKEIKSDTIKEKVNLDVSIPGLLKSSIENEILDLHHCIPDELESSEENDSKSGSSVTSDSKDSRLTEDERDDATEKTANNLSKETLTLGDVISMPDWGAELSWHKSSSNTIEESKQQSPQKPTETALLETNSAREEPESSNQGVILVNPSLVSVAEESDHVVEEVNLLSRALNSLADELEHAAEGLENAHVKTVSTTSALTSEAKEMDNAGEEAKLETAAFDVVSRESTSGTVDKVSDNINEETGSITFHFDLSTLAANCGESGSQNVVAEHLETQNKPCLLDSVTEPASNHPRYSPGETSFSASGPLSGLISYSGPIAYSGSLSIRSDSSTTSTRSFAFPILQSEWISSPVRMAKADRKHHGKYRRWTHGLLCCRF